MGNANEGSISWVTNPRTLITQIDFARAGQITPAHARGRREGRPQRGVHPRGRRRRPHRHPGQHPPHVRCRPTASAKGLRTKVNVNLGISGDLADDVRGVAEGATRPWSWAPRPSWTFPTTAKPTPSATQLIDEVARHDRHRAHVRRHRLPGKSPHRHHGARTSWTWCARHAEDGVDFVTIHAGMNRRAIEAFKETGRLMNIV